VGSRQVGEDDGKSEMSSTRDGAGGGGVDQNIGHNHRRRFEFVWSGGYDEEGADCIGFQKCIKRQEGQRVSIETPLKERPGVLTALMAMQWLMSCLPFFIYRPAFGAWIAPASASRTCGKRLGI